MLRATTDSILVVSNEGRFKAIHDVHLNAGTALRMLFSPTLREAALLFFGMTFTREIFRRCTLPRSKVREPPGLQLCSVPVTILFVVVEKSGKIHPRQQDVSSTRQWKGF